MSIKNLQDMVGKPVELVEYSDVPTELISNALNAKFISDIRITEKLDGDKMAVVVVSDQRRKGAVVGRDGRNAEKARLLAKRYFQISSIHIVAPM